MPYDIGKITRELQQEFRLFRPRPQVGALGRARAENDQQNRATPQNISILLNALDDLTDQLKERRLAIGNWVIDAALSHWDTDFDNWVERLDHYIFLTSKAPPDDRQAILWDVTAPLLLGFYGGEHATTPQQRIDAVTPFVLANQLQVDEEWRVERWVKLKEDLMSNAKEIAKPAGIGLGVIVGVGVGAWVLHEVLT